MKNIIVGTLLFVGGYSTSQYFYSKYVTPENISSFAKQAYRLGCLTTIKNYSTINKDTVQFCEEKSTQHKKSLDILFSIVL